MTLEKRIEIYQLRQWRCSSTLSEIRILSRKSAFVFGWIALFLYVAAQTGVNSFFINYATEHIAITDSMAATLLSFGGMGLFMLGRLGGSWAMGASVPNVFWRY